MKRLKAKGIELVLFETAMKEEQFFGTPVERSFEQFATEYYLIVANRQTKELEAVKEKVYTRDLFSKD